MAILAQETSPESVSAPVIAFDGVCNLCNRTVDFVISRDRNKIFRFLSLQSDSGRELLERAGMPGDRLTTLILVENGRSYIKSTAVLRIVQSLGGPWRLAGIFWIIPRALRDVLYDLIALHRYRWFGTRKSCRVPSAEEKDRFMD